MLLPLLLLLLLLLEPGDGVGVGGGVGGGVLLAGEGLCGWLTDGETVVVVSVVM